jgi:hypothetical protein
MKIVLGVVADHYWVKFVLQQEMTPRYEQRLKGFAEIRKDRSEALGGLN